MKLKTLIIFRIKTTSRANAHSQAGRLAGAGGEETLPASGRPETFDTGNR